MEVEPGQFACGYHYHEVNENIYIIGGHAVVRTPEGEKNLKEGDAIAFPASPEGARVIRNESATEKLVYLDAQAGCPMWRISRIRHPEWYALPPACTIFGSPERHPCSGAFPRFFRRRGLPSCGPRPSGEETEANGLSPVGYNVVGAIYS